MPCLLVIVTFFFPRLAMLLIFFTTRWFSSAYQTALWPVLGFFFMPYTTLAYMAAMLRNDHTVSGGWLALVIVAALIDFSGHGSVFGQRRKRA
jgi:hypothetical protein